MRTPFGEAVRPAATWTRERRSTHGHIDDDVTEDLVAMWRGARDEMTLSYRAWCASRITCASRTAETYAIFVAARDRADAAHNALAAHLLGS